MVNPIVSELQLLVNLNNAALVEFEDGTRILRVSHGRDASATSANSTSIQQPLVAKRCLPYYGRLAVAF
jgi:hypothetical protein